MYIPAGRWPRGEAGQRRRQPGSVPRHSGPRSPPYPAAAPQGRLCGPAAPCCALGAGGCGPGPPLERSSPPPAGLAGAEPENRVKC